MPLLGNRVDRFRWNGSTLTFDRNLIRLRAFQADAGQPLRGNHNGGVIRFGPDGKLYIVIGDNGRRGLLQNLVNGPFGPGIDDDQFGGPEPDDAHLTGVILRLNDDGTTPTDNPFFAAGATMPGQVGANIQKIFAYGLRNSFGMAFDPVSGTLWEQENGDDSFSELNIAEPGFNSGWIQIMGPPERIAQFKAIETDPTAPQPFAAGGYFGLQQIRWSPTNIADTPAEGLSRLFMLPGAHYSAPEMSWKFEVAPAGIGFLSSRALGPQYRNDLFVGGARAFLEGGHLFHFNLTGNRRKIGVDDPRLEDRVADNIEQVGHHREREPALRPQLRRRDRHPDRTERQPLPRLAVERRHLRDLPPVASVIAPARPTSAGRAQAIRSRNGRGRSEPARVHDESQIEDMRAAVRGDRERAEQARQRSEENVRALLTEPDPEPAREPDPEPDPEPRRSFLNRLFGR